MTNYINIHLFSVWNNAIAVILHLKPANSFQRYELLRNVAIFFREHLQLSWINITKQTNRAPNGRRVVWKGRIICWSIEHGNSTDRAAILSTRATSGGVATTLVRPTRLLRLFVHQSTDTALRCLSATSNKTRTPAPGVVPVRPPPSDNLQCGRVRPNYAPTSRWNWAATAAAAVVLAHRLTPSPCSYFCRVSCFHSCAVLRLTNKSRQYRAVMH